jgi:hypothetical protein
MKQNTIKRDLLSFLVLSFTAFSLQAQEIKIPDAQSVKPKVSIGKGSGDMSIASGTVDLKGQAQAPGVYTVNWNRNSTVLDYYLPSPITLPKDSDRLSMIFKADFRGRCDLRFLVSDIKGGLWAVGTRMSDGGSRLRKSNGYEYLETYSWDTSEVGRRDPWVMTSLNQKFNEYTPLTPPLKLVGFRLALEDKENRPANVSLRGIRNLNKGAKPDPYWILSPENVWNIREGNPHARYGRFGWAPENPGTYLKAADLRLPSGKYKFSWELLDGNDWKVMASRSGELTVDSGSDTSLGLDLPLLLPGSYRLYLFLNKEGKKEKISEFFMHYVIVRNGLGESWLNGLDSKLLKIKSSNGSNIFKPGEKASVTIEASTPEKITLSYRLESTDGKVLAEKKSDGKSASIDLEPFKSGNTVLWLKAELKKDGRTIDISRRILGFTAEQAKKTAETKGSKLDSLNGKLRRAKGDWKEGWTPVATKSEEYLKHFDKWLDEAKEIGYNIVELSAPAYDLNPLPGVYQFHYLDKLVAAAKKRGLKVMLRVHPNQGQVQDWVPRKLMEDQRGFANGLWGGGSIYLYSPAAPEFKKSSTTYLEALGRHYCNDPEVLGVTLEGLFFDHDMIDQPWLGLYVDYSESMRQYFIEYLQKRYDNDLIKLGKAYGKQFNSWEQVEIPKPDFRFDSEGRLEPRSDAVWHDWIACKVQSMREFYLNNIKAFRQGDPGSYVGIYHTSSIDMFLDEVQALNAELTIGAMENMFPPNLDIPGRFEPHAKVARIGQLVDLGMTNVLMAGDPGKHSIFNYWQPDWELEKVETPIKEAEERLQVWFKVVDQLVGAKSLENNNGKIAGICVQSYYPMQYSMQHLFKSRFDDYLKPYKFRMKADKIHLDSVDETGLSKALLEKRPYVYLPYCSDVLSPDKVKLLKNYVDNGGRLIVEATSGFWTKDGDRNVCLKSFGLPEIKVKKLKDPTQLSEEASWTKSSPLKGTKLAFRVNRFVPPTNTQKTPWIHNIAQAYLQPYELSGKVPAGAEVAATFSDGSPAALIFKIGKGQVLLLVGVVDWLECPGLTAMLDDWGQGIKVTANRPERGFPKLLVQFYRKKDSLFAIGRRFIGHDTIRPLKGGKIPESFTAEKLQICFPEQAEKGKMFKVRELLGNKDLGEFSGEKLQKTGVSLDLKPGQGFLLEVDSVK